MSLYNNKEIHHFNQLLMKVIILISPFMLILALEMFVLPVDFFTFRVWEAALAQPFRYPGPFYPNLHVIKKKEYGDRYRIGVHESKSAEWYIDSYGWRNRPEIEKMDHYDIILTGDSNIVGSFLDQKDTLSEVLSRRSNKTVYSYSFAHDSFSLLLSDPRPVLKTAKLLIVESKAGNWNTNNSYLVNFKFLPDGTLDLVDRSQEFTDNFYSNKRNIIAEKLTSRIKKQPLWHSLKAQLQTDFSPTANNGIYVPEKISYDSTTEAEWRPVSWKSDSLIEMPLPDRLKPALMVRSKQGNAYWHTEKFVSARTDGRIILKFDAKNSITDSKHPVWIFEDGIFRQAAMIMVENRWKSFEIVINSNPGSVLELQIDQPDNWQWMLFRNLRVIDAKSFSGETAIQEKKFTTRLQQAVRFKSHPLSTSIPRPKNLTPLDKTGKSLSIEESQYYFYQAVRALHKRAKERNMDFIFLLMPDEQTYRLQKAIGALRSEGIKVIFYEADQQWPSYGINPDWYWNRADSHWTEAAVRLTADEILRMWQTNLVKNRPFSASIMADYTRGFPGQMA